ncbi:MAG TPA: hypothetical protein VNL16_15075 [Chloroflexota bacterium]|nr:hypothetical protein [Chloroflexota bacterium]
MLLGVYHGVNPGMGWLFAVARGFQQGDRRAVLEALIPIAAGHESSVTLTVALVSAFEFVAAPQLLRAVGAVVLILFGLFKLLKPGVHPRWVGMRVSRLDLVAWSFLMSTAHGAGLMLFPILMALPTAALDNADSAPQAALGATVVTDLAAVVIHTTATMLVMGAIALIVYDKVGLSILRRAWVNLDALWAVAVMGAGVFTLVT